MTPGVLYQGGISKGRTREYFGKKNKGGKKKKSNFSPGTFTDANTVMVEKAKVLGFSQKGILVKNKHNK